MRTLHALAAAALLVAGTESVARAHSPNIWERTYDPVMAFGDIVHREVETLLSSVQQLQWYTPMGQEQLGRALRLLDTVKADTSPDVRLRLDFGRVVSYLGDDQRAARVVETALMDAPDHPAAIGAYFSLAISYAKLGRPEEEIAAFGEYLRRETNPIDRSHALSNRAEAYMLLGRLAPAISDYRASIALQPDNVLAHWGLAVALDRNGDAAGALAEAKAAITYDPLDQQLASPNVFFVPSYEHYWYDGVGAMARAQQIDDAATAILWWETAVAKWMEYVGLANDDDRWLPLAKAHQASCQKKLDQAKKTAARAPKMRKVPVEEP